MGTRSVAEDRDVRVCVDCAGSGGREGFYVARALILAC